VAGRCQRCGRACESPYCRSCQAVAAELQAKKQDPQPLNAEREAAKDRAPKHGQKPGAATKYPPKKLQHQSSHRGKQPQTKPPAEVVRSFKAVGSLQLHRLGKRVSFQCVTCRRRKKEDLIAITSQNWRLTVCRSCYVTLALQTRTKKTGEPTRQPPRKAKRAVRQRGETPVRTPVVRQSPETVVRQSPGTENLLKFFRDASIDVQLDPSKQLWIDGGQVAPLASVPPPEKAEWINLVNEIAMKFVRDKFIKSVADNARFDEGLAVSLLPRENGVAIMRGDEQVALIHPAHTSIPQHPFIYANFLTAGPHWQRVATILQEVEAERTARFERDQKVEVTKSSAWQLIDQLPDDLSPELINACLDASRRIRLERQLDYGDTPVVLESDDSVLTLLPIAGTETRLFVPFRFIRGVTILSGELLLRNYDPLPVQISADVLFEDAIAAWTCALLGFADATCFALDSSEPTGRRDSPRPQRRSSPQGPHRRPTAPTMQSRSRWPDYLVPVGRTIHYVNSFVRGHRRRLPNGWTASDERRTDARRIGIILDAHETWVQAHARGMPEGAELHFIWHRPTEMHPP